MAQKMNIDRIEVIRLQRRCSHAREIIAAVGPALNKVDESLRAAQAYLEGLEFEARYAEEVDESED